MICPNIIIITSTDRGPDEESAAAVQMLTERYSDRTLIHFKFTVHAHNAEMTPEQLTTLIAEIDPKDKTIRARDTGVYALFHGGGGIHFGETLSGPDRAPRGKADQLAKVILEFRKQGFQVRKICFVTCLGIKTREETSGSTIIVVKPGQEIFVQDMCKRLSGIAEEGNCHRPIERNDGCRIYNSRLPIGSEKGN